MRVSLNRNVIWDKNKNMFFHHYYSRNRKNAAVINEKYESVYE